MKHFDALMQCLVTEAPARYCSVRQRHMIAAEVASYFRGVDQANATIKNVVAEMKVDPRFAAGQMPNSGRRRRCSNWRR